MKCPLVCALVIILTLALTLSFMTSMVTVKSAFDLPKEFRNKTTLNAGDKLLWESKTFKESKQMFSERRTEDQAYEILDDADIVPPSARIRAKRLFNNKPFTIWTKDWKTTRLESLVELLRPFGVHFVIEFDPQDCSNPDCTVDGELEMSPQMDDVDLILCGRLSSTCEYFLKSGKNTLVLPNLSHYANNYPAEQLNHYSQEFSKLAKKRKNIFGSTNTFDAKFFHNLTGIEVQLLPMMFDNLATQYSNELDEFALLTSSHIGFFDEFYSNFTAECQLIVCSLKVETVGEVKEKVLHKYRAVIVVPDEFSMTSVLETYHKNIPIFLPSSELLAKWKTEHQIIPRRIPSASSRLFLRSSQSKVARPRLGYKNFEILNWMKFTDFYQSLPYAIKYNSIKDLVSLMSNISDDSLWETSKKMQAYNVRFKKDLITKWRDVLLHYTSLKNNDNY